MRTGVDLSQFNTGIGYQAMRASGVDFAYIRLTEGQTIRDNMAATHIAGCQAAGIPWGGYHFFLPARLDGGAPCPPATQAAYFMQYLLNLGTPQLPPAVDVETADSRGFQALASGSIEFCDVVENELNVRSCTYYCNVDFARNLPGWPFGRNPWLADPTNVAPTLPRLIRQCSPGQVAGSPDPLDLDQFVGTTAQFAAFTGQVPIPTDITEGATPMSIAIDSAGRVHVERVRADGHLIHAWQTGQASQGYAIVDITDAAAAEFSQSPTAWKFQAG